MRDSATGKGVPVFRDNSWEIMLLGEQLNLSAVLYLRDHLRDVIVMMAS